MAESEAVKSGKASFKSKWSRVFKEKEEHEQNPKHTNSFKLDDDVNAFLKPSTDKAASTRTIYTAPKLDVAIAQRWPDAHEVRRASSATPGGVGSSPNGYTKPKRRNGLRVGFVKTVPEIIGEGGDEAMDPPTEVGRMRAAMARSVSDGRPSEWSAGTQGQGQGISERLTNGNETAFRPQLVRRVQTSHNEVSPPVQRKQISPPVDEQDLPRPMLRRTPTVFDSQDDLASNAHAGDLDENAVPRIDTRFAFEQSPTSYDNIGSGGGGARQTDANALATRRKELKELRSGEGMVLRRASQMIQNDDDDEAQSEVQKRQSLGMGVQPQQQVYDALSRPDAPSLLPEVDELSAVRSPQSAATSSSGQTPSVMIQPPTQMYDTPRSEAPSATSDANELSAITSPQSSTSPGGPSPFDDPKYITRHSRETSLEQQPSSAQSLRQKRPEYQPSYMHAAQQPTSQQVTARRPVPQVQPPRSSEDEQQRRRDEQPSYMRAIEPPNADFIPTRAPPIPSQNIRAPQDPSSHSRDPSPMRDRIFGDNATTDKPRPFYSRPNDSGGSLNHFAPSPKLPNSRTSSRDGDSPRQASIGSALQQPSPSSRHQTHSPSPQSGSPRSSTLGRPSGHSSYFRNPSPSPQDYSVSSRAGHGQPAKSPAGYVYQENSASRPDSSGSNRSFQRPAINFARPMMPQGYQTNTPAINVQQDDGFRPLSAGTGGGSTQRQVDSFSTSRMPLQGSAAKSTATNLRQEDAQRPGSSSSGEQPPQRPTISPQPTSEGNPAADTAYADFAARVAHMKGVFRLTAEKEQSGDRCSPRAWLRTALWWYLRGKAGLEVLLQSKPRSHDGQPRELLVQPHVDLAKTWWILSDPLEAYDTLEDATPQSVSPHSGSPDMMLKQSVAVLRSHIKTLSFSISRNQLMPPHQSLIQGQDTRIWLEYPRFTTDAAAVLGGTPSKSTIVEPSRPSSLQPLEAIPICDTRETFAYGRFPVEVSINTDDAETDRVVLPCMLSTLRGKRDFLTSFVVASQTELVNIRVGRRQGNERGLTWHDVSWKANSMGMTIRLPRGFDLTVRMQEKDFRSMWNLVEYARKVEHSLQVEQGENLIHEARVAELQYADSSNSNAFPTDKLRGAEILVFERTDRIADGSGDRKAHRGYRVLFVTDPSHKSLASASHEVCREGPLYFEFITDSAANGMAAMVVRIREESRQCRILLVFPNLASRQNLYDVLNGLTVRPDEMIVSKMSLMGMNIEPATQIAGFSQFGHPALRSLQWQNLGITNTMSEDPSSRIPSTIASESLRVVARHATGCITDRLNLSKGELLLRLPCVDTPAIQIMRNPQEDLGMSIDIRNAGTNIAEGIGELMQTAREQPTIRTFTFGSLDDLHSFQAAVTGSTVRYDGLAATLSISRRMMVVPIYKKWEANKVRLQVVTHSSVVQVLAFMEDFSHADAMCFQVKSTDKFEAVKGDGKGKKWAVKMVDAKFSLPHVEKEKEDGKGGEEAELTGEALAERVQRRFVNLEGLDYAEEHDDITVGFETQEGECLSSISFHAVLANNLQSVTGSRKLYPPRRRWREESRLNGAHELARSSASCSGVTARCWEFSLGFVCSSIAKWRFGILE